MRETPVEVYGLQVSEAFLKWFLFCFTVVRETSVEVYQLQVSKAFLKECAVCISSFGYQAGYIGFLCFDYRSEFFI